MTLNPTILYNILFEKFGKQNWWPIDKNYHKKTNSDSRFEIITGAILTQNTAWSNVEKALYNLKSTKNLDIKNILKIDIKQLQQLIKPSGFFNQKADRIKNIAIYINKNYQDDLDHFFNKDISKIREELLSLDGIGPETADSIILYAGNKPIFVVDAYTKRLCIRIPLNSNKSYDEIQKYFQEDLSKNYSSLIEYQYWVEYWLEKFGKIFNEEDLRNRLSPGGDIDNDGIANIADIDSDGDTLSDGFEIKNNTDPAIQNTADASNPNSKNGGNGGGGGGSGSKSNSDNSKATNTTITLISSSAQKSDTFFVEGYVKDDDQSSVANMTIEVFVNKSKDEPGDFAGSGEVNSNGYFYIICEVPETSYTGVNHIVAHAIPNSNNSEHGSSWSDPTINISSETKLKLNMAGSVGLGFPLLIKGCLTDIDNITLDNKSIKIYIDNIFIEEILTDDEGIFRINHTFNELDDFFIQAFFDGEEYLNSSNDSKTITVIDTGTDLDISINPTILKRGEQFIMNGNLTYGSSIPLGNSEIIIYYNEEEITTTVTSDIGTFEETIDVPINSSLGKITIKAQYPGNTTFSEAIAEGNIFIQSDTKIFLSEPKKKKFDLNETLMINGTLTDDLNTFIEKMIITIDCSLFSEETITDENGEFFFEYIIPNNTTAGPYKIKIDFKGNNIYLPSTKIINIQIGQNSPTEKISLTPYLIISIVGSIAIFFSYRYFIKRRKKDVKIIKEIAEKAIHDLKTDIDPRKTVIDCYNQMCKLLKRIGIKKAEYQTPREFAKIAEKHMKIPPAYIYDLTQIFEKAKYSTHEINNDDKEVAIKCLNNIISTEKKIIDEDIEK